jgi:hypothetical protein
MSIFDDLGEATRQGAENAANMSGGLRGANTEVGNLTVGMEELNKILEGGFDTVMILGDGFIQLAEEIGAAKALTMTLAYLFMDIDDEIRDMTANFGQTNYFAEAYLGTLIKANEKAYELGIPFDDLKGVVQGFTNEMGRMVMLTDQEVFRMATLSKATGLGAAEIGKMVAEMSDLGMGTVTAMESIEELTVQAQRLGLNVNTFINSIGQNIKLVNQYGFDKGINGLAKMVAKAQSLKFDIQQAVNIADGILDGGPERAVEMAAELAMLGGDIGELGDPFALMFNSLNDVGAIQDSLVDLASAAATINEETGQLEIPTYARERLRQQAKVMGVSFEELTTAALNSKKQMMALDEIEFSGLASMSDEDKQFISSISEINEKGEMVVKLKEGDDIKEIKLTDEDGIRQAMEELKDQQEDSLEDPKDVLLDNTRALLSLKDQLATLTSKEALIRVAGGAMAGAGEGMGSVGEMLTNFRDAIGDVRNTLTETANDFSQVFKEGVTDEEIEDLTTRTIDRLTGDLDSFAKALDIEDALATFRKTIEDAGQRIKEVITDLGEGRGPSTDYEGTPGTKYEEADDFISRPGENPLKFNEDDIVIGGTNLFGSDKKGQPSNYEPIDILPSMIERQSSVMESIQNNISANIQKIEQTMSVKDINVNVNGSISVTDRNGNMVDLLRNPDVKNQIVMIVEDAFEKGRDQFV